MKLNFLIDDEYTDQPELTFLGHDDDIEDSLFEQVDYTRDFLKIFENIMSQHNHVGRQSSGVHEGPGGGGRQS